MNLDSDRLPISASTRRLADRILIVLFLAVLFVSGGLALVRSPGASLQREFRRPSPAPEIAPRGSVLKKLPAASESYFNDRLPWRERMLEWHADLKVRTFGVSSSEKVILGRDGWLFLDEEKENGGKPHDPDEQCRLWLQAYRRRHAWCAARGIEYVLLPVPEKHSIYPEFLPDAIAHPRPQTAASRLRAKLAAGAGPRFVELAGELTAAKRQHAVYFRTDTHWNDRGGLIAYRVAGPALGYTPLGNEEFAFDQLQLLGDLNRMLRLPRPALESFDRLSVRNPKARQTSTAEVADPNPLVQSSVIRQVWETGDKRLRCAVIFHDSFAEVTLLPALAEHFQLLAAVPTSSFDPAAIARYRPDIVIQEFAERKVNWHMPAEPAGFGE